MLIGAALSRWAVAAVVAVALGACGSQGEETISAAGDGNTEQTEVAPPGSGTAMLDGDLHPGEYHTERFDPNFSFTIRDNEGDEFGWRGGISRKKNAAIAKSYGLDPAKFTGDTRWSIVAEIAGAPYFEFIRLVDPEREATSWGVSFFKAVYDDPVETLVDRLRSTDGLKAGDAAAASVGGAKGLRFDAAVTAAESLALEPLGSSVGFAEGQQVRFIVVEVAGATKVVTIEAPQDEFAAFLPEAEELLSTVQWWPEA